MTTLTSLAIVTALSACVVGGSTESAPSTVPVAPTAPAAPAAPGATMAACEVLTAAEVGELVGGAVEIKPDESGPGDDGYDHCAWRRTGAAGAAGAVLVVSPYPYEPELFHNVLIESSIDEATQALPGVGDAAFYRAFDNGAGATLLARQGKWALVLSGTPLRDALTRGARIAFARMGG